MNIAFLIPSLANKGPVIVVRDLCEQLKKRGHSCTIFYFKDDNDTIDIKCDVEKISFFRPVSFTAFDVIHIHCFKPAMFICLHRRMFSEKVLISTLHHPITHADFRLLYGRVVSFLLSKSAPIVYNVFDCNVVLSSVQRKLSEPYLTTKMKIIGNGRNISHNLIKNVSDISFFNQNKNKRIIGSVSVVTRRKGIDQIVRALKLLSDEYILVCIGDGDDLDRLKILAKELHVDNRCFWFGYRKDATNYYKFFDVYALCSYSEGFPLSFIEAAGYGCSSVLSDIEILRAIVSEDFVCFYQIDNISSLASQIQNAYNNRVRYGCSLQEFYLKELTADKMAEKYLDLYANLIKDKYGR